MTAKRLILETDELGNLKHIPQLPPNQKLEVIILESEKSAGGSKRRPHPDIAGKIKIKGDIFGSIRSQPGLWRKLSDQSYTKK